MRFRTREDIAKAKASIEQATQNDVLYNLPPGYIAGGDITIDGTDVFIGPLIANINGKQVQKGESTNVRDMVWTCREIPTTYYYVYLDRLGLWTVTTVEPDLISGFYGLYKPESGDRFIAQLYVDADGDISDVVSHRRLKANDIETSSIKISGLSGAGALAALDDIDLTYVTDAGDLASLDDIDLSYVTDAGDLAALNTINATSLIDDDVISLAKLGDTVISGGYLLTSLINADVIQTKFLEATGAVVIGFEGTGSVSSPDERDRRIYVDGDELVFQQYTDSAWTTVNQMALGGTDSDGVFMPFLSCRGLYNPLADTPDVEPIPNNSFRVLDFESDKNDQNGVAPDSDFSTTRSTTWSAYGTYSLTGDSSGECAIRYDDDISLDENFGAGFWFKLVNTTQEFPSTVNIISAYYRVDASNYLRVSLKYDQNDEEIELNLAEVTSGAGGQTVTLTHSISLTDIQTEDRYLAFVLDHTENNLTLIFDSTEQTTSFTDFTLSGASTTNEFKFNLYSDYLDELTTYIDDVVFATNDGCDKDLFLQHYNSGQPWTAEYTAEDIYLKPADGGRVRFDDLNMKDIPTSSTGLRSGDIYSDSGTLKVVS